MFRDSEITSPLSVTSTGTVVLPVSSLASRRPLVRFMNSSRGRDKVLFGTNGLGLERCRTEFLDMDLKEETKTMVLHDNAVRFLKLEE